MTIVTPIVPQRNFYYSGSEVSEFMYNAIKVIEKMDLPVGIEHSLVSILKAAINSLGNGNEIASINQLQALINLVEVFRGNKLTDEEADSLIAMAQWIIDNLSGT